MKNLIVFLSLVIVSSSSVFAAANVGACGTYSLDINVKKYFIIQDSGKTIELEVSNEKVLPATHESFRSLGLAQSVLNLMEEGQSYCVSGLETKSGKGLLITSSKLRK